MHGLTSWADLPSRNEALPRDPYSAFTLLVLAGLIAFVHLRPSSLDVVVTLEPAPAGVVWATLTPLSAIEEDGTRRTWKNASCEPAAGSCRLSFRWGRNGSPSYPKKSVLELQLRQSDGQVHLGDVALSAPTWGAVERVVCSPEAGCRRQ
jgi:hypothetical protein